MHSPVRSEADVFRAVVLIGMGLLGVVAVAVITDAIFAVALAALLIGLGVGMLWRGARGSLPSDVPLTSSSDDVHRILVIANETVGGGELIAEIGNRSRGREAVEVLVVTPALPSSKLKLIASDVDESRRAAESRLAASVEAIKAAGVNARGEVGDEDPNAAIDDALQGFAANELIISTHPVERSHWLERGVVERARSEIALPITHVVVHGAGGSTAVA